MSTIETQTTGAPEDGRIQDPDKAHFIADAENPGKVSLTEVKKSDFRHSNYDYINPALTDHYRQIADQEKFVQRVGVWAGILYEHPVSEDYAAEHTINRFGYTAQGIAEFEAELRDSERTVHDHDTELEKVEQGKDMDIVLHQINILNKGLVPTGTGWSDTDISKEELKDIARDVEVLIDDPNTTIGQLAAKYAEVLRARKTNTQQAQFIEEAASILDDIQAGRASDQG